MSNGLHGTWWALLRDIILLGWGRIWVSKRAVAGETMMNLGSWHPCGPGRYMRQLRVLTLPGCCSRSLGVGWQRVTQLCSPLLHIWAGRCEGAWIHFFEADLNYKHVGVCASFSMWEHRSEKKTWGRGKWKERGFPPCFLCLLPSLYF